MKRSHVFLIFCAVEQKIIIAINEIRDFSKLWLYTNVNVKSTYSRKQMFAICGQNYILFFEWLLRKVKWQERKRFRLTYKKGWQFFYIFDNLGYGAIKFCHQFYLGTLSFKGKFLWTSNFLQQSYNLCLKCFKWWVVNTSLNFWFCILIFSFLALFIVQLLMATQMF